MPLEEDVFDFLIFWSNFIGKAVEREKIDILHCPLEKIEFFCPEGVKMSSCLASKKLKIHAGTSTWRCNVLKKASQSLQLKGFNF